MSEKKLTPHWRRANMRGRPVADFNNASAAPERPPAANAQNPHEARRDAERRVREQDAARMERLRALQEQTREFDEKAQSRALDELRLREERIREDRREAMKNLDEHWERARRKLSTHSADRGPNFGMAPPQQDPAEKYRRMWHKYQDRRKELEERYEHDLSALKDARTDLTQKHAAHNERRDQWQAQIREELARQQAHTFEDRTAKEMERGGGSLKAEFNRSAERSPERGR